MSEVIAFPTKSIRAKRSTVSSAGPKTLFLHVKRVTLIAHLARRDSALEIRDEKVQTT